MMPEPRQFNFNLAKDEPAPEFERYELREPPQHRFELDRRDFFRIFKTFGAGLAVFAVLPKTTLAQQGGQGESGRGGQRGGGDAMPPEISAWIHISDAGAVTVSTGKAEVGQNIRTSLSQQVAEELRVPLSAVTLVMADTALTPFDMGTFGSRTTPQMGVQLRHVSAGARSVLLARAAQVWGGSATSASAARNSQSNLPQAASQPSSPGQDQSAAPANSPGANPANPPDGLDVSQLVAADGKITNRATGQSLSYAELVRGQHLFETVVADPALTPPADWHVMDTPAPKVDGHAFVTGAHQYSSDIARPGMVYGRVLRPSAFNARLASADVSAAQALPGVKVVRDGEFIGVTAPDSFAAQAALGKITARWDAPPQLAEADLFKHLKASIRPPDGGYQNIRGDQAGDISQAIAGHQIERTYTVAYIQHAPLEPRAAVAEWSADAKGDKLTVWTGSQRPFGVRDELAEAFHLPKENIRVIVPDTGSAYGGKHTGECAVEAARLAKAAGKPVKLIWTREEEFTWAYFRPAGVIDVRAGANKDGTLVSWQFQNYNSGPSAIETLYTAPNRLIQFHQTDYPLRQGSYRGLAATANHFARESAMDELAHDLDLDPLEFRLKNLTDPRLKDVFHAAAEKFGWGRKPERDDIGFGIAGGFEKGGYVACAVEAQVIKPKGTVVIRKVVEAWDCGPVMNPDGLRNTVMGGMIQGLGGALFEAVHFDNGKILNPHFAEYRVPRFTDVPAQIDIVLIDRKNEKPFGAGETPIVGIAPALASAIFQATGVRLRAMPLAPNGVDCGCEVKFGTGA